MERRQEEQLCSGRLVLLFLLFFLFLLSCAERVSTAILRVTAPGSDASPAAPAPSAPRATRPTSASLLCCGASSSLLSSASASCSLKLWGEEEGEGGSVHALCSCGGQPRRVQRRPTTASNETAPQAPPSAHAAGQDPPSTPGRQAPALSDFWLCAVVLSFGDGHCDRHPLVAQVRAEASLSATSGTPDAAHVAFAQHSDR